MLLNGRTVQPLMKLLGLRAQSESIAVARQKLNDAMSEPAAASPQERPEMLAGKIEIEDLGLTQPNHAEPMFAGLNTTVEPGQMLLLDGASGRSAEGFIDLLVAQRGPTSGRILIDGQAPDAFAATRGEGGIVAVDALPVLFAGTILENISAFGDGARIEYALHLSKMLSLEETVHRLPLGYNTPVGDGRSFDDNPSNSQLISLVRALALRPKLLVLNEPSALLEDAARRAFARGLAELPLMKLLGLRAQSESIAVARQKLNDAMSEPAAASPQERPEMLAGKIEIEDLGLTQPNHAEPMFAGLNTTVEPGQMLLLDGASGRSAEGFIDLLVAQRGPTSGRILIDGQAPDAFAATRGEGGIVAVDALPVLFAGTILENISAFGDGARIEYALHLSKMLSLEETVHRLPLGYNTPVGDGRSFDDNPSNSQLISLVRALALRP
ncbi:ABC transporter B family member 3 (ABC transporter ABCB.3), partial [Durusdinium trenchii]